jgi:GNAT superfamily N-acetyltransferase
VGVREPKSSVIIGVMGDDAGMADPLLERARALWADLARVPVEFPHAGTAVVVAPDSWLCPAGWVGVVVLGGAALVTAPDESVAGLLRGRDLTDVERLPADLSATDVLGPASLAYLGSAATAAPTAAPTTGTVPAGHPDLAPLLAVADAGESGLADIHSAAFVVREENGRIVAAAGYQRWPTGVAQLGVLTAPDHRGRGLARVVGAAATADAVANGMLAQWRARLAPSRRVAAALGYRTLGAQVSLRLDRPR